MRGLWTRIVSYLAALLRRRRGGGPPPPDKIYPLF